MSTKACNPNRSGMQNFSVQSILLQLRRLTIRRGGCSIVRIASRFTFNLGNIPEVYPCSNVLDTLSCCLSTSRWKRSGGRHSSPSRHLNQFIACPSLCRNTSIDKKTRRMKACMRQYLVYNFVSDKYKISSPLTLE